MECLEVILAEDTDPESDNEPAIVGESAYLAKIDGLPPIEIPRKSEIHLDNPIEVSTSIEGEKTATPDASDSQKTVPEEVSAPAKPKETALGNAAKAHIHSPASVAPLDEESDRPIDQKGVSDNNTEEQGEDKDLEGEAEKLPDELNRAQRTLILPIQLYIERIVDFTNLKDTNPHKPDDKAPNYLYAIAWSSRRQSCVAGSAQDVECMGLANALLQDLFFRTFMTELAMHTHVPTHVLRNNTATIELAAGPTQFVHTKHIDIKGHFVRDYINRSHTAVMHVPIADNLAEAYTKVLDYGKGNPEGKIVENQAIEGECCDMTRIC
jgi:hypothetical protein